MIECHFDNLIHNRLPRSKKQCPARKKHSKKRSTQKSQAWICIQARASRLSRSTISPDLLVHKEKDKWIVEVSEESLPSFRVAPLFLETLTHPDVDGQEKLYLRRQIAAGKWLQRIVRRRHTTLKDLGELLAKKHASFLNGDKKRLLLTRQDAEPPWSCTSRPSPAQSPTSTSSLDKASSRCAASSARYPPHTPVKRSPRKPQKNSSSNLSKRRTKTAPSPTTPSQN